jgi:hypothetical protein
VWYQNQLKKRKIGVFNSNIKDAHKRTKVFFWEEIGGGGDLGVPNGFF